MKRVIMILGLVCAIVLAACQKKESSSKQLHAWMAPGDRLKVLSTTSMIDDLVKEIGGEYIHHRSLIRVGLDPHSYELVKGDQEVLACADIVFYNGLDLEHGASLKYQLSRHGKAYSLGDALAKDPGVELVFLDRQVDPHIWMDVQLFSHIVPHIVQVLSIEDPVHAPIFKSNGELLQQKLLQLDTAIRQKIQSIPSDKRYLVTSHDAFFYFARRYLASEEELEGYRWMERFAAPEGLAPDGQISPKDIQMIVNYALRHQVKVVFPESNVNQDALRKVIAVLHQRGAMIELAKNPLYGDAMGLKGSQADGYLQMMEYNAEQISKYLHGEG